MLTCNDPYRSCYRHYCESSGGQLTALYGLTRRHGKDERYRRTRKRLTTNLDQKQCTDLGKCDNDRRDRTDQNRSTESLTARQYQGNGRAPCSGSHCRGNRRNLCGRNLTE